MQQPHSGFELGLPSLLPTVITSMPQAPSFLIMTSFITEFLKSHRIFYHF